MYGTYASKSDTGTGSWGLVHLTEDKGDLGVTLEVDDRGLLHLVVQIVALTGTLADAGENGVTTVGLGDVVDELLDEHGLADTGTAEETNLSTTSVGGEEIDDLDTSLENLGSSPWPVLVLCAPTLRFCWKQIKHLRLLSEGGSLGVNGKVVISLDGSTLVDRVTLN